MNNDGGKIAIQCCSTLGGSTSYEHKAIKQMEIDKASKTSVRVLYVHLNMLQIILIAEIHILGR